MSREMKILILSPHIDAQHPIVQALKARGDAVLVSNGADEGWKVLQVHGASMDLAVLHREGTTGGDPGTELNKKIKKTSTFADLPVLFTTESWSDEQCAVHQQTPEGANAYLHWPFDGKKLIETIEAIFGPEASMEHPSGDGVNAPTLSIIAPVPKLDMASMVLEEPSQIFDKLPGETTNSGIRLSNFEGKAEGTNVRLEPQSTAAVSAPKAPVTLQSDAAAPALDLLDVSLSEPSVAQPTPPPPALPEGGLDLLSVEEEKPSDPPHFAANGEGTGVSIPNLSPSIDIGSPPPLAPPLQLPSSFKHWNHPMSMRRGQRLLLKPRKSVPPTPKTQLLKKNCPIFLISQKRHRNRLTLIQSVIPLFRVARRMLQI
jgi:DNA-binding response OmpR family regulator